MDEQLTRNFNRGEFACLCGCGFDSISAELVEGLQHLRNSVGRPIGVLSGCRCAAHNAIVGGSPCSQHLLGNAADIRVVGMSARELYSEARKTAQFRGFGVDDQRSFIHVDVRDVPARWCYSRGRETQWHGC